MNCHKCSSEVMHSWKFCPQCGFSLKTVEIESDNHANPETVPIRFLELIADYENLTGSKISSEILRDFRSHPASNNLSVIDRERRLSSGRAVRKQLAKGLYSLDLHAWLNHIYDNPKTNITRVWTTTRGDKYHLERECKGLRDGQNYARFFGKDTYNPQFLELRYVAFVLGKSPCAVCKPPLYKK
jgi:hypothetical protein